MTQTNTQATAWDNDFSLSDEDVEKIYNHFLEVERPMTVEEISAVILTNRLTDSKNKIKQRLVGRTIYQPSKTFEAGEKLVFPGMNFAHGSVNSFRAGQNPEHGEFSVAVVDINGKEREFATGLAIDHPLNENDGMVETEVQELTLEDITAMYGNSVSEKILDKLNGNDDFIRLADEWFVSALLADINEGHVHLSEAVLDMHEGGPLLTKDILVHLDFDASIPMPAQEFSLNNALNNDPRFDEVAPKGEVAWFLHRFVPEAISKPPMRIAYTPIPYDRALLNPQLVALERELDDEWSELSEPVSQETAVWNLTYPHRWAGTLPLNSRIRVLLGLGKTSRQQITLIDEQTGDRIPTWAVLEHRYIHGLTDWYKDNNLAIGAHLHVKKGEKNGEALINFERRRERREYVRLATAENKRITFDLEKRGVPCGFDDLLIVGTDHIQDIDDLFIAAEKAQKSIGQLLTEVFPSLMALTPQNTVHAKTLYAAMNTLRRVPPAPLFAELVRHPAFVNTGDLYWTFDSSRWQG